MYRLGRYTPRGRAVVGASYLHLLGKASSNPPFRQSLQSRHQATVAPAPSVHTSPGVPQPQHSANYIAQVYSAWRSAPESVHESWREYFQQLEHGIRLIHGAAQQETPKSIGPEIQSTDLVSRETTNLSKLLKVHQLVQSYRSLGHLKAQTNPLGLSGTGIENETPVELEPSHYGFADADFDERFPLDDSILPGFAADNHGSMALRQIIRTCEEIYCGSYGVEYTHIPDARKREWIRSRLEIPQTCQYTAKEKKELLEDVAAAATFERFIATKYPLEKRYGLDGGESLVPGMKALVRQCIELGAKNIIVGSQHRGRLNVMSNVLGLPNELVLQRFAGEMSLIPGQTGDVKYHLGIDSQVTTPSGKQCNVSFLPNPSHLEAENPVAIGKTRAIQDQDGGYQDGTVCINLHGDAALAGQGVVYETLTLSQLSNYSTGGTIHITVNNQVGFTTDPQDSRSTLYCTDVAKAINAPIFHVNGDDPEAVAFFFRLAADWRAAFKSDVFIDLVCYRRYGHNEMDQAAFTQPHLYNTTIAQQRPVLDIYTDKLLKDGTITQPEASAITEKAWNPLASAFEASKTYTPPDNVLYPHQQWSDLPSPGDLATNTFNAHPDTSITPATVAAIADKIASVPAETFTLHPNLARILTARKQALTTGTSIDWATAEALAIGSLCLEHHPVRLAGQDAQRGTFSHRHAVLHNQSPYSPTTWTPLAGLSPAQAPFTPANSPLNEFAALGFEYGYALGNPAALVVWEAQFGDFANGAQVAVDNFVASGEAKWAQRSGVVLSLPHGFDGMGPEHSSARVERFLQLCAGGGEGVFPSGRALERGEQDANMVVVCVTVPANLFHVLRRQVKRAFRKPLVIFFSKSLLRHPLARSKIEDFTGEEAAFRHVIADPEHGVGIAEPEGIDSVVLCSGQVYAALHKHREASGIRGVALTRIEQLNPFPWVQVKETLDRYPNAKRVIWCQEEPANGGAWQHVRPRIEAVLKETRHHSGRNLEYVGRDSYAGVATGSKSVHVAEETEILNDALNVGQLQE